MTTAGRSPMAASGSDPTPPRAARRYWEFAPKSATVLGVYLILLALLAYEASRNEFISFPFVAYFLVGLLVLYLARYLSTTYWIDDRRLRAFRLFGGRSLPLAEIRKIEIGNLRDLGPVSYFHGWGWRGRMWSPIVGKFDSVHTVSPGLLITASAVPLFVSPREPAAFARELSRRVRSSGGMLVTDDSQDEDSPKAAA
jgi:hypothetical protein